MLMHCCSVANTSFPSESMQPQQQQQHAPRVQRGPKGSNWHSICALHGSF